jgi:Sulfotransferase domain
MSRQKVFCIGLGKTGTTSLKEALRILGYRTIRLTLNWQGTTDFDAALPGISAAMYRDLDAAYPGSKFILTVRDMDRWLKSIEHDFERKKGVPKDRAGERYKIQMLVYGTEEFDKEKFRQAYLEHERKVLDYFRDRPDDLLVFDITTSADWDRLCAFLNVPLPDTPFPHVNKAAELDQLLIRLYYVIRDVDAVARISKYSTGNIDRIIRGVDLERYDPDKPVVLKDDRRINKVLKRASRHFGGPAKAAQALNLPEDSLRQAIRNQKQHARSKIRPGKSIARLRRFLKSGMASGNRD